MTRAISILCYVAGFCGLVFGDQWTNCKKTDIHFEKVLGYKPSKENHAMLLYKNDSHPVTIDCIQKCQSNDDCRSFILDYSTFSCYWYRHSIEGRTDSDIVPDSRVAWFVKICLRGRTCSDKLWIFERIPAAILIGNDTKILPEKVTRNECEQNCLSSKDFECRSAKFRVKEADYSANTEVMGSCTLSDTDRRLTPNSFRIARDVEEYFENQCSSENRNGSKNDFCSYEEYGDVLQQHVDLLYEKKTKSDCEGICNRLKVFHCRGFSLKPTSSGFSCLIHSEDIKIYGPRLLKETRGGFYYEKARCLNITVSCTEDSITINYRPEMNFLGRIYMEGYSNNPECFIKGQGFKSLNLILPLPTSQCGITEAITPDNRRLLSGPLIIQYNSLIQTQGDRLIRVGCIFSNDSKLVIGTGVTVAPFHPDNGSVLISTSSSTNDEGSSKQLVQMKLVDHYTHKEVSDIEIGQDVDLVIQAVTKGTYDIWASHLVAMTENSVESIILLDDTGCPVDNNVFPPMVKLRTGDITTLIGSFQAFKFSSSSAVRFSIIVQFCPEKCPEVDCRNLNRPKRAQYTTLNGTIQSVNRTEFEHINSQFYKRPLEIMVVVRNQHLSPDRLAFGSNKVLVAGYNYETNEVCVDYSLLLGLVISWVLIQIIFAIACIIMVRKYKKYYQEEYMRQAYEEYNKNFDIGISNLDSRRVRWADSGDEMQ